MRDAYESGQKGSGRAALRPRRGFTLPDGDSGLVASCRLEACYATAEASTTTGILAMRPLDRFTARALTAALAVTFAIAALPAHAAHVNIGVLTCKVSGGPGFVFGSSKDLECKFEGINGLKEPYHGAINKFGIDIGFTGSSYMVWTVLAPSQDVPSGALAGNYGGISAEATVGLGVGANALIGGFQRSIALQPLSGQVQEGLNVAVGIAELELRSGR